jgi:hypothetical protein
MPFRIGESANTSCIPGEQRVCACAGGGSGVQVCDADGQHLLPCQCGSVQTGSCTLYPDCRGCTSCFATCICHSQGDVVGCFHTCGLGDAGADARPDAGQNCELATCLVPPRGTGTACCTEDGKCGFSLPAFGMGCIEANQPGNFDPSCPSLEFSNLRLQGCCRPDGHCGVHEPFLPLGCVARDAIDQDAGTSCTPNGT